MAVIVNTVFLAPLNYNKVSIAIAVLFFTFQIYCDFSAYSDIAKGCAKTMGYNLMINFNKPYLSETIGEFWRRWHISLGNWFKDYLYIPLGGKSNNKLKSYRNLLLVFFISGLWHGASWNFIVWGGIHGLYLILEKNTNGKKKKSIYKVFRIFKIFILVSIACFLSAQPLIGHLLSLPLFRGLRNESEFGSIRSFVALFTSFHGANIVTILLFSK